MRECHNGKERDEQGNESVRRGGRKCEEMSGRGEVIRVGVNSRVVMRV